MTRRPVARRISRRMLLTEFGAAGAGVLILGACSSDDDGGSADTRSTDTQPAATDPPATDAPATDPPATDAPVTDPPATDAPPETDAPAGGTLQLQHVSLGFVSAYVLLRGNEAAIVDTGVPGSGQEIADGLTALGASFADVAHVVLTHKHGDHVGGLAEVVSEATGAMVYAGEADIADIISGVPLTAVGDGDEILGMGVLNTPGHTPGSISLFDTETGILVAGDAVNGDGAGGLTGANADFSEDMGAAADSIATLAALESSLVAFGHGGPPVDDAMAKLAGLVEG